MTTTLWVQTPAIHCEGCANAIKRSLGKLHGVQAVDVDVDRKRVSVQFENEQVSEAALRERLTLAGYPAE
jgi:copper chaperone CopZ